MTPRWVPKSAVLAIHEWLLSEHGGPPGILSEAGLDAALASPQNHLAYGASDLFELAAQYTFALTKNHPFQDGNKRVALTVAGVFLELNGHRLNAPEADAVSAMLAISSNELDAAGFAAWLRTNTFNKRRPGKLATSIRRIAAKRPRRPSP